MKTKQLAIILLGLGLALAVIFLWRSSPEGVEESDAAPPKRVERERTDNDVVDRGNSKIARSDSEQVLESIELVEIQQIPEFGVEYAPIPRKETFRDPKGRSVTLQLKSNREILSIAPSPSHSHYLVCQGASREWSIYDSEGKHLDDLPSVSDLAPEAGDHAAVQWKWRLKDTLIATVEQYESRDPSVPRYPDEDSIPKVFGFYDYHMDSKKVRKLKVPERVSKGLLRLEGVSDDGTVVISSITEDRDYWGERDRSELHAFNVSDAQRE